MSFPVSVYVLPSVAALCTFQTKCERMEVEIPRPVQVTWTCQR